VLYLIIWFIQLHQLPFTLFTLDFITFYESNKLFWEQFSITDFILKKNISDNISDINEFSFFNFIKNENINNNSNPGSNINNDSNPGSKVFNFFSNLRESYVIEFKPQTSNQLNNNFFLELFEKIQFQNSFTLEIFFKDQTQHTLKFKSFSNYTYFITNRNENLRYNLISWTKFNVCEPFEILNIKIHVHNIKMFNESENNLKFNLFISNKEFLNIPTTPSVTTAETIIVESSQKKDFEQNVKSFISDDVDDGLSALTQKQNIDYEAELNALHQKILNSDDLTINDLTPLQQRILLQSDAVSDAGSVCSDGSVRSDGSV
jgi:hypothetical protein